jgi:hypothetical protein
LQQVSDFFESGSIGYSPNKEKFEGMKLHTTQWKVTPLDVTSVHSSFFEDKNIFPEGSIQFDNALLMREVEHEWRNIPELSKGQN